jgi:ABC-2 type transport system permease protein
VIRELRAELLKQRTTRTTFALFVALLGSIVLAELLHGFGLPADALGGRSAQLMVLGLGELLGSLFAALLGALSITTEIRHGTIRPTFLVTPRRERVVAGKVLVSVLLGAGFGLIAGAVSVGVGAAALDTRGVAVVLDAGDQVQLVAGAVGAAALWAAIGVGIGAVVRNQVPAVIGICTWILFIEGLLADATGGLGAVGRYLPGSAGAALAGLVPERLLEPVVALAVLVVYAITASLAGAITINRRDVA